MHSHTSFIHRWLLSRKKQASSSGFTLLELLISLIVASMVVSGLLYMVVELTKIDKREATVDQVQSDMKRAMDYITDDLQEAVYVYTDPTQVTAELIADSAYPTGAVPVLAFWRIDPLESLPSCNTGTDEFKRLCNILHIRQSAYTLVVYFQKADGANSNRNWPGQSRIIRYELSRYTSESIKKLEERPGYRDPASTTDKDASFEKWKAKGTPTGFSAVLVDFVQSPTVLLEREPLAINADDSCSNYGTDDVDGSPLYTVVPQNASFSTNTSFFACVRNPDPDNDAETSNRANQDIYVFLRGSTQGAGIRSFSDESSLPILETQVLVKGIIDKNI
ncbi:MAG: prepilin-type N-terminal cleavage/methylation domain-containing protein [Cyanobacteria bacterium J06581_3]